MPGSIQAKSIIRRSGSFQSNGVGITLSAFSLSGSPNPDEGFAYGDGISDDFKLWLSRHPGLTIEETLHRFREEQKAKRRRQGPKLH